MLTKEQGKQKVTILQLWSRNRHTASWTDISSDSAQYKVLGNSVAIPCVDFVLEGIALVRASGKQNPAFKTGAALFV